MAAGQLLQQIITKSQKELLGEWLQSQLASDNNRSDLMKESELREQCREFLALVQDVARNGELQNLAAASWTPVKEFLAGITRSRAIDSGRRTARAPVSTPGWASDLRSCGTSWSFTAVRLARKVRGRTAAPALLSACRCRMRMRRSLTSRLQ